MNTSVKLANYSTTEIYEAVVWQTPGSGPNGIRFAYVFEDDDCTLLPEYKSASVKTSRWFRGYFGGKYRDPKFTITDVSTANHYWDSYNKICSSYPCDNAYDISLFNYYDVCVGTVPTPWYIFDPVNGYWVKDDIYTPNMINEFFAFAPYEVNPLMSIREASVYFRVANPGAVTNEYQSPPAYAKFTMTQAANPGPPTIWVYIDPTDKGGLSLNPTDTRVYTGVGRTDASITQLRLYAELVNPGDQINPGKHETELAYRTLFNGEQSQPWAAIDEVIYTCGDKVAAIEKVNIGYNVTYGSDISIMLCRQPKLTVLTSDYHISWQAASNLNVDISTTIANGACWDATCNSTWITISNETNNGDGTGYFKIAATAQGYDSNARSAKITIDSSADPADDYIHVYQDGSIHVNIQKLNNPPKWMYACTWQYNESGESAIDVSFGFDSSRNNISYDVSIISMPSWLGLRKAAAGQYWHVGDTVSPFTPMKPYPLTANSGYNASEGSVVIGNAYGDSDNFAVTHNGKPIPPAPITDFTADVSVIHSATYSSAMDNSTHIKMHSEWYYVLTITNVSTNTITFPNDASVAIHSFDQYQILADGYDSDSAFVDSDVHYFTKTSGKAHLPETINVGNSWNSGTILIRPSDWDSSTDTHNFISFWNDNMWTARVYYKDVYHGLQLLDNDSRSLVRRPKITLNPTSKDVSAHGLSNFGINVDVDGQNTIANTVLWEASAGSYTWITMTSVSDYGDGLFYINVAQQSDGAAKRTGYVTVKSYGADATTMLTVTQDASVRISINALNIPVVSMYQSRVWQHNQYGAAYECSFGFDSSYDGTFYDASITAIPSWIQLRNPAGGNWSVGDTISPYTENVNNTMRPSPLTKNGGQDSSIGYVVIENLYGDSFGYAVTQSGLPDPGVNFSVDVSIISRPDAPGAQINNLGPTDGSSIQIWSEATHTTSWQYVLKVTNLSGTDPLYLGGASIGLESKQGNLYGVIDLSLLNQSHLMPTYNISAGDTWESVPTKVKTTDWISNKRPKEQIQTVWTDNWWRVTPYYSYGIYSHEELTDYVIDFSIHY